MDPTPPGEPRRQLTGLLVADVISTAGTEITAVALPWFVLISTGSPTRMSLVLTAEFIGMTVLGLWGGQAATWLGPRRMMLASDLARAALVALIPITYWFGILSFGLLLAVGFVVGAFFPGYASSQRLVLAGIVGDDELRLTRVGGLMSAVNETASFVGPALGGLLVVALGAANVLVVDAVSYLCAFALLGALIPATRGAPEPDAATSGMLAGLRYIVGNRSLRRQLAGVGLIEIGWTAMVATLPVLALHSGGASIAGWLLGAYGGGSVIGGLISSKARAVGGSTAAWSVIGIAASSWLLLVPVPAWAYAGAVGLVGVCNGLFFPRFFTGVTIGTPPALRSQVMTAVNIAISAPGPVGFLGAGILAQYTGSAQASLLFVAAAATLGAVVTTSGLRARLMPDSPYGRIGQRVPD